MNTTATSAAANPYRPKGKTFTGTIANGTYSIYFIVDLPIVHDPASLTGALFAHAGQNYLNFVIETALQTDVFSVATGGAIAFAGTVRSSRAAFFSIPTQNANNARIVILPNAVQWIHEFITRPTPHSRTTAKSRCRSPATTGSSSRSTASPTTAAPRRSRQPRCPTSSGRTPLAAGPHQIQPSAAFAFGEPRLYNGLIEPGATYWILDFELENWQRDGVYPRGLSELTVAIYVGIAAGTTVNANAHVHTVQETLTTSS